MWSTNAVPLATVEIMLILVHYEVFATDYGSCETERFEPGRCNPIEECEPLLNVIRDLGRSGVSYVNRALCPLDTETPTVCCPRRKSEDEPDEDYADDVSDDVRSQIDENKYGPLVPPACGKSELLLRRIVDGNASEPGDWPWAVILRYRSKTNPDKALYLCGGALISTRHVLTAAHCVQNGRRPYMVRLGEYNLESENDKGAMPFDVYIERRTIHPEFDPDRLTNDVAVLKLGSEVPLSKYVQPLCLPLEDDIPKEELESFYPFIVGWGAAHYNGPRTPILQQFRSPVVAEEECRERYEGYAVTIDKRVICAGFKAGGKDACQGDSGGPMMNVKGEYWYSLGIISYGFRCAVPHFPGVYTRTSAYIDFIKSALN